MGTVIKINEAKWGRMEWAQAVAAVNELGGRMEKMPQAYIDKLKHVPVLIGHERCASSQFMDGGEVLICVIHAYSLARRVLHNGKYYNACRECIEENCQETGAVTEEKPRGLYENIGDGGI